MVCIFFASFLDHGCEENIEKTEAGHIALSTTGECSKPQDASHLVVSLNGGITWMVYNVYKGTKILLK